MNRLRKYRRLALVLGGLVSFVARGGPVPFEPAEPLPPPTKPPIVKVAQGVFELGKVRLDKNTRTISFPGTVNMTEGLIEYVVVHGSGKIHESLLRTEAEPYHVHLATLLLSENPTAGAQPGASKATPANQPEHNVTIRIAWTAKGNRTEVRAEDLILNVATKTPMTRAPWRYVGSQVIDGIFLAQRDGSMIAVIDDPGALVKNTRPGSENDENWEIRREGLPDFGTPVTISIELEKP